MDAAGGMAAQVKDARGAAAGVGTACAGMGIDLAATAVSAAGRLSGTCDSTGIGRN